MADQIFLGHKKQPPKAKSLQNKKVKAILPKDTLESPSDRGGLPDKDLKRFLGCGS
jgi:hypothetical protein